MKAKYLILGCMLCAAMASQADDRTLKVNDVNVVVNEKSQTLDVNLRLNLKDFKISRNGEVVYTPVVVSKNHTDSVVLPSFTVCGRNQYYYYLRAGLIDKNEPTVYRSGRKQTVEYNQTVRLQPWMLDNSMVEVRQEKANCCSKPELIPGNLPDGNLAVARINSTVPNLDFEYVFAPPVEQEPVSKSVEGKAFVTFVVNKTDLNPSYMKNPQEIRKITNSIDVVKADPDAIITEIHIRGYASPEGPYQNNVRLAQGRTETLANYVNSLYKFPAGIMTTSYDPEDWNGLRSYVADSLYLNLENRAGLLSIIDGNLEYDARDAALRTQFPRDYQILLKEVYPWLRHSDYAVKYNVKVYTDIENLMRLYNSDPSKLRAVDFYTIAQQYPIGSKEYQNVMKKAIQVYPEQPMINLNMANIYLIEGQIDKAEECLYKAGSGAEAYYARGIVAARNENFKDAAKWFKMAQENGIAKAGQYLEQIEKAENANPVEILIKTTSSK